MTAHNIDRRNITFTGVSADMTPDTIFSEYPESGCVTFEVPGVGSGRAFNYTEQYPEPPMGCVQFEGGQILCGGEAFGCQEDVLDAIMNAANTLH